MTSKTVEVKLSIKIPAWVRCVHCEGFFCTIHLKHAAICPCPPVEEWTVDPYTEGGRPL